MISASKSDSKRFSIKTFDYERTAATIQAVVLGMGVFLFILALAKTMTVPRYFQIGGVLQ